VNEIPVIVEEKIVQIEKLQNTELKPPVSDSAKSKKKEKSK
jgi:hypothetical protein